MIERERYRGDGERGGWRERDAKRDMMTDKERERGEKEGEREREYVEREGESAVQF